MSPPVSGKLLPGVPEGLFLPVNQLIVQDRKGCAG